MIDCRKFEEVMMKITREYFGKVEDVVAIDGKTVRGSADSD